MMRAALVAVALCAVMLSPALAVRQLAQAGSTNTEVNVRNTFAEGERNDVGQEVMVYVAQENATALESAEPAKPMFKPRAVKTDPFNPDCAVGHSELYMKESMTTDPITDAKNQEFQYFVSPDAEIQPVVVISLHPDESKGEVKISGDGLRPNNEVEVSTRESMIKTICGEWTHKSSGLYDYTVTAKNANVWIQYYSRARSLETMDTNLLEAFDVAFAVDQTVVGDNHDIQSTATVTSVEAEDGTLTFTLSNNIKGSKKSGA